MIVVGKGHLNEVSDALGAYGPDLGKERDTSVVAAISNIHMAPLVGIDVKSTKGEKESLGAHNEEEDA